MDKAKKYVLEYFKSVKDTFFNGEKYPFPQELYGNFLSYIGLGVVFIILSISLLVITRKLPMALFPFVCAIVLFLLGLMYRWAVTRIGYNVKVGRCIDHGNNMLTVLGQIRPGADYFLLETETEILRVTSKTRKKVPPLDSFIKVFVSKNSDVLRSDGITTYTSIFGYAFTAEGTLPGDSDSEEKVLAN